MKKLLMSLILLQISACGVESLGTAAAVGKMQADQAKQAQENMAQIQKQLDENNKLNAERLNAIDNK